MLLQDIMNCEEPFGSKCMVLGKDFRQVLPVISRGSPEEQLNASIKRSSLWHVFRIYRLEQNLRAENDLRYSEWLLKLGNGELQTDHGGNINVPAECITDSNSNIIRKIYGDRIKSTEEEVLCNKTILCSTNDAALQINNDVINILNANSFTYFSIDRAVVDECDDSTNYTTEFLNSLNLAGLTPHMLTLKVGACDGARSDLNNILLLRC